VKEKLQSVQVLRGVAALSVVFFHLKTVVGKYSDGSVTLPDCINIGQSGVDLFFVISGFIMVMITYDEWGKVDPVKFLLKRFSRIYPVYWFYTLLTLLAFYIRPMWVNASQHHSVDVGATIFLLPSVTLPLVMVAWSLQFELLFYCAFSAAINRKRSVVIGIVTTITTIIIAVNSIFSMQDAWYWCQFFTNPFIIEFLFGVLCALAVKNICRKIHPIVLLSMLAFSLLCLPSIYFSSGESALLQRIYFGMDYSLLVFSAVGLEAYIVKFVPAFFSTVGDGSYSIYLSHLLLLNAVAKSWFLLVHSTNVILEYYCFITVAVCIVVVWSIYSAKYIERPSYRFLHLQILRFVN
jgi:exopolysaccharide production protein ExoZ